MRHVILIPLLLVCIAYSLAKCDEKNNSEEVSNFVADSKASIFRMTWHPGGAEKQENIPVAPSCFRVHHIETQPTPPKELKNPLGPGAEYGQPVFSDFGQTKYICGLRKSSEKVVGIDEFYIDLNHNGLLEKAELFKGKYHDSTMGPDVIDCHYGPVDLTLSYQDARRIHRVFAWYHMLSAFRAGEFYLTSHCYLDGQIRLGDKEVKAVLIDYNCDGRYGSGQTNLEWIGTLGPRESDYDRIGWDIDGDGEIYYSEQHFVGGCTIYKNRAYRIDSSPDGRIVTVRELKVPMGHLHMPAKRAYVSLVGELGPIYLNMSDGVTAVPAGTYWVDYARIEEPNDSGDFQRITKSGVYFEKPWQINPGMTTTIERQMLIVTEQDRQRYEEKMRAMRPLAAEPKVESILNKPLGNIEEFGLELNSNTIKEKSIFLCFFDMEQRPSRNCLLQLSKWAQKVKAKDVVLVAVQASRIDPNTLNEWVKENNIPFPVGMIEGDSEKTRFAWGVRSLPWLILTDREHVVVAEGFGLDELNTRIDAINKKH